MNELTVHYIGVFFLFYIYRLSVIFEARKNILIHERSGVQEMQEQQQAILKRNFKTLLYSVWESLKWHVQSRKCVL